MPTQMKNTVVDVNNLISNQPVEILITICQKSFIKKAGKRKMHDIDQRIFGSFIEDIENCLGNGLFWENNPLTDEKGIRKDAAVLCKELSPTVLRFPGGTVMGIYHWQDYVGPVEQRKKVKNIVWGGLMTYQFGTCEFIELCRFIGAEPMICINMPTGSPEEAAAWVEYCNGTEDTYYANLRRSHGYEEPFGVKYWCIGNESYAVPDLGMQDDVNVYIRESWEYVKYMKMTDPTIELVFVGNDNSWNEKVLDSLSPVCDYLSVHHYGFDDSCFDTLKDFEDRLNRIEALLSRYNESPAQIDRWYRIPPRRNNIGIALDEWNIWNSESVSSGSKYGLQQCYTWKDALWVATFLNLMIRHCNSIKIANIAQMVNVIAPIIVEKDTSWKQTIFYPFAFYRKYCGEILLESKNDPVDTVLTQKESKRTLFCVNIHEDYRILQIPFANYKVITLNGETLMGTNSADHDIVSVHEEIRNEASCKVAPYGISIFLEA